MDSKIDSIIDNIIWIEDSEPNKNTNDSFIGFELLGFSDQPEKKDLDKLRKVKENEVLIGKKDIKIGGIFYTREHGYVRIDNIIENKDENQENIYECYTIEQRQKKEEPVPVELQQSEGVKEDSVKVVVQLQQLANHIMIQGILIFKGKTIQQNLSVCIHDPLQESIQTLEQLHQTKLIPIYNGTHLNLKQSAFEQKLYDGDRVLFVDGEGSRIKGGMCFYRRFQGVCEQTNGGWNTGKNEWDGLTVIPSRDVTFFGVGIYERWPNGSPEPFILGYKYMIKNPDGSGGDWSQVYEETINPADYQVTPDHYYEHKFKSFPEGIKVQKDQSWIYYQWVNFRGSHFGDNKCEYYELPNDEPRVFTFKMPEYHYNYTNINRGEIPGFLYL